MALATGTLFNLTATATTGNVNGAGFNSASANFPTDLAATVANTSAPVVTSASYNFVAGDVGNYVFVKSGTHWQAGWYLIASVAANAATLTATVGSVITAISAAGVVTFNTVVGCTSDATATLSSGTWGVDYSLTDTANATSSTATSSGAGSVILFAGSTQSMIGNFVHVISGTNFTAGWYEITGETAGVSITTDRACTTGVGATGVINIGGAGRLNGLEDAFQAMLPTGALAYVKNGAYTLSGAISTANTNSTSIIPAYWIGYNTVRGDTCNGANRPVITAGANAVTFGQDQFLNNLSFTTTAANGISATAANIVNCKFLNTSSTTTRKAFLAVNGCVLIGCEVISQNGPAVNSTSSAVELYGCYIHDSTTGYSNVGAVDNNIIVGNLFEANITAAIAIPTGYINNLIQNNTIYGREAQMGTGISLTKANSADNHVINNIIYGCATGISVSTGSAGRNASLYNDFFNNTADVSNWVKDPTDLAVNPSFTGASQLTGSTATSSGSVLTDSGASFGVTDNVDFLHVVSGTGATVGCYLITSHTGTTLTVNNAIGTSNAGNLVYWVSHGHNFQIGTNLKGIGFPNYINATGSLTTSYPDVGGVQRQESSGTSGGSFTFVG